MVTCVTPREVGRGWELVYGTVRSVLGEVSVLGGALGLCEVSFGRRSLDSMRRAWPQAILRGDAAQAQRWIRALEEDEAVPLVLRGTPFQQATWQALLAVPPGHTVRYGELAARLGRPRAARAVGAAVGRNALAWAVPCHRVIRADGQLGGFRWSTGIKAALLAREVQRAGEIAPRDRIEEAQAPREGTPTAGSVSAV